VEAVAAAGELPARRRALHVHPRRRPLVRLPLEVRRPLEGLRRLVEGLRRLVEVLRRLLEVLRRLLEDRRLSRLSRLLEDLLEVVVEAVG
jgi:hypothetical protein